jgi:bacterioferritin-associated ferredoxin
MENEIFEIKRPEKVCLCKGVSKDQIIASIHRGNHTIEAIAKDTTATTGCGTCKRQVQKILEDTLLLSGLNDEK